MRLLLNFISQMLCSSAKTQDITHLMLNLLYLQLVWFMHWMWRKSGACKGKCCILCWSLASGTSPGPKGAAGGEVLNTNQHILDTFISCCGPDPLAGLGLFFYEQQLPAKIKWLLWPRLVSSAGGGHRPVVSPEGPPDLTSQIRESSSKEVKTGCKLKQHFENNVKFKQHWPVNITIILKIIIFMLWTEHLLVYLRAPMTSAAADTLVPDSSVRAERFGLRMCL